LLPVGDRAIIELTLYWLRAHGIREVAIALGWRGDLVRAFIGDGSKYGVTVTYAQERERLGTCAPITLLRDWIGDGDVFLMNGDIMTQMNLAEFVRLHGEMGTAVTIATRIHRIESPYGVFAFDDLNNVLGVREKPVYEQVISAGMYLIHNRVIGLIDPKIIPYDMTSFINDLCTWKQPVGIYRFTDPWLAVERASDYEAALSDDWQAWASSLEHRHLQLVNTVAAPPIAAPLTVV
jgi:mannose-1-phosphate guanylyltransferase